ncbi:hypothetical protein [Flagellimonas baculiformis]|uniref:hypothetical protein n=1 Tax=Flagellimonas baculiformis TaxID=3067310 RepID=UPI00296EB93F|nr:hypothetical protein [Muricauda sp. D6]
MGRSWKCFGHDLTDAPFGLTDVVFGLMGKSFGFLVSSSKGGGTVGFGFQVLGVSERSMQFSVIFVILSEAKNPFSLRFFKHGVFSE